MFIFTHAKPLFKAWRIFLPFCNALSQHTQIATISLYLGILFVSQCLRLHNNKKYCKGDQKTIMITENLAKYRLINLKCICYDTFQHSSMLRVGFVKQLARVQMICPHPEYLSCRRAFQPPRSMPYRDYCCFGNIFKNLLRCILAQKTRTEREQKAISSTDLFLHYLLFIQLSSYWS